MVTFTINIPLYVSIYTSTMDPSWAPVSTTARWSLHPATLRPWPKAFAPNASERHPTGEADCGTVGGIDGKRGMLHMFNLKIF